MSEEDLEVVLEGIRRFEASDFEGVSRRWHPDSWITGPEGWPERGPFEGRAAVLGQFRRLAADWGEHRVSEIQVVGGPGGLDRGDVSVGGAGRAKRGRDRVEPRSRLPAQGGKDQRSAFPLDPRGRPRSRRA